MHVTLLPAPTASNADGANLRVRCCRGGRLLCGGSFRDPHNTQFCSDAEIRFVTYDLPDKARRLLK